MWRYFYYITIAPHGKVIMAPNYIFRFICWYVLIDNILEFVCQKKNAFNSSTYSTHRCFLLSPLNKLGLSKQNKTFEQIISEPPFNSHWIIKIIMNKTNFSHISGLNKGFRLGRQECESAMKGLYCWPLRINVIPIIFYNQVHFHTALSKPKYNWENHYCIIISTFALGNKKPGSLAYFVLWLEWEDDGTDELWLLLVLCPFSSSKMFNFFRSCRDKEH